MRRLLLVAALTLGAMGATAASAWGEIAEFDIGDARPAFNSLDDHYVVLSANNQLVNNGPKAAFAVRFKCGGAERIGMSFFAEQVKSGTDTSGQGQALRNCSGDRQHTAIVVQRTSGPDFRCEPGTLDVQGNATSFRNGTITDNDSDSENLHDCANDDLAV